MLTNHGVFRYVAVNQKQQGFKGDHTLGGMAVLRVRAPGGGAALRPTPARKGCCRSLVALGLSLGTLHFQYCLARQPSFDFLATVIVRTPCHQPYVKLEPPGFSCALSPPPPCQRGVCKDWNVSADVHTSTKKPKSFVNKFGCQFRTSCTYKSPAWQAVTHKVLVGSLTSHVS